MKINISGRYLLLPTERNSEEKKLHFYIDGKKVMESDVKLATGKPDFVFAMDVSAYDGKELEIHADADDELLSEITCSDERPAVSDDKRPLVHFTAESGWINDPNGLVYADGIWHLFYQWNPYGVTWGNMHWGHAVSKDLLHWEHKPVALLPDDYGPMFSGSGWQDKKNVAGYGKDALLFYYTAAGGDNTWSKELSRRYVQRLAVSADGGTTLEKKDTVLSHVVGGNRDPKVFWHEESKAYIMMLYLEETEFAIYRSTDLLHWEESSRLSGEKMWECPDLFELTVDGTDGETRWVFWSADGLYRIGTFDGYSFTPETDVLAGYDTTLPYAAQTYAGVSGRVISVAWYRTANDSDGYRGMMAIPAELSLAETSDGLRIRFCPVREFGKAFPKPTVIDRCDDTVIIDETKIPAVYELKWSAPGSGKVQIGADTFAVKHDDHPTTLIVDHGIAEYFSKEGTVYGAVELMGRCQDDMFTFG